MTRYNMTQHDMMQYTCTFVVILYSFYFIGTRLPFSTSSNVRCDAGYLYYAVYLYYAMSHYDASPRASRHTRRTHGRGERWCSEVVMYMHMCVYIYIYVCMYVYIYIYVYISLSLYIYIYMYAYISVYIYVYYYYYYYYYQGNV